MENERLCYINSLECRKVVRGDNSFLSALKRFNCGDEKKNYYDVSCKMLERFKSYIVNDFTENENQIDDIYYIVWDGEDIFLFFSLQTSLVFSIKLISPNNFGQMKEAYKLALTDYGYGSSFSETTFTEKLGSFEGLNEKYSENDMPMLLDKLNIMIESRSHESQDNLYVDRSIPSIEMVNFCKNHGVQDKWERVGIETPVGATLFWYKILPIIKEVSEKVGCVYVTLFAADATPNEEYGNRNLLSYYKNAFKFQDDLPLSVLKPYYDWKCIFLCQKILTLCEEEKSFKENFLSGISDDDV